MTSFIAMLITVNRLIIIYCGYFVRFQCLKKRLQTGVNDAQLAQCIVDCSNRLPFACAINSTVAYNNIIATIFKVLTSRAASDLSLLQHITSNCRLVVELSKSFHARD